MPRIAYKEYREALQTSKIANKMENSRNVQGLKDVRKYETAPSLRRTGIYSRRICNKPRHIKE